MKKTEIIISKKTFNSLLKAKKMFDKVIKDLKKENPNYKSK